MGTDTGNKIGGGDFEDKGLSFKPRGKGDLLSDLDEALAESLDEFHDMEERPRINLVRTVEGKLILGNQITIMESLKYIMTEMWVQNERDIG